MDLIYIIHAGLFEWHRHCFQQPMRSCAKRRREDEECIEYSLHYRMGSQLELLRVSQPHDGFFCMYLRVLLLMIKMTSSFFLRFDCVILSCQVRSAAERSATSVATQGSTAAVFCIVRINGKIVFRQALDSQGHQIFFATCCPAKRKDNSNQCLRRSSGEPRYVSTLVSPVLVCYYMLIIYIHVYIYTCIYTYIYI